MENLYSPHKDPLVAGLFIALLVAGGFAYALNDQLNKCRGSSRGHVHTISLAAGIEQKITSHDGKVYIMIEAPGAPNNSKPS